MQDVKVSRICHDLKYGTSFAVGTENQWFEFRVTNKGRIRLYPQVHRGVHPYFTLNKLSGKEER